MMFAEHNHLIDDFCLRKYLKSSIHSITKGSLPDRGEAGQLADDARQEQRQEADDREDRQAQLRDHPPHHRRCEFVCFYECIPEVSEKLELCNVGVFVQLIFYPHWPMNQLNKNPNIA